MLSWRQEWAKEAQKRHVQSLFEKQIVLRCNRVSILIPMLQVVCEEVRDDSIASYVVALAFGSSVLHAGDHEGKKAIAWDQEKAEVLFYRLLEISRPKIRSRP